MVFSSILFLFRFMPAAFAIYYLVPRRFKNFTLLVLSLIFYSWGEAKYFPIMIASTVVDYTASGLIESHRDNKLICRLGLIYSVVFNLGMLGFFKYTNFIITSINTLAGLAIPTIEGVSVLPLGISFYTFQTMSYSIDVYRRGVPSEHNFIDFGAYVVMFPQLIAGPIVKYRDVAERLHIYKGRVTMDRIEEGVALFIFGLAKKVLLADTISALWHDVIGTYSGTVETAAGIGILNASTPLVWLGLIAYSFQLYFDFSGYSMMGIGMGKMLGFDFPDNFNLPYISRSITEFWRRWHITLSSWFKEYVYIPLGGNRKGLARQIFNIFVVWLLTGIWHGANWNFILWGLYYFVLLIIEKTFLLKHLKKGRVWPHIYTLFFVVIGWALFVGNEPGVGLVPLFTKLFIPSGGVSCLYFLRNYAVLLVVSAVCCTPLPLKIWNKIQPIKWVRLTVLGVLFVLSVAYIVGSTSSPFLYFNF